MKIKNVCIFSIVFFASSNAHAQIPVTDALHITQDISNQLEIVSQWTNQYNQMYEQITQINQRIQQAEEAYSAVTGSRGMGSLLSSTSALSTDLTSAFSDLASSIKSSSEYTTARANYPTYTDSSMTKANNYYDLLATHEATMKKLYAKNQTQIADINSLLQQIDSASDPAAKMDLMNRLSVQQNALSAKANLIKLVQANEAAELKQAEYQAAKEEKCFEFKDTTCE